MGGHGNFMMQMQPSAWAVESDRLTCCAWHAGANRVSRGCTQAGTYAEQARQGRQGEQRYGTGSLPAALHFKRPGRLAMHMR